MRQDRVIFDLGFHNGDDTHFYLAKGYRVIAVEANDALVAQGRARFASELKAGQLVLVHRAVSPTPGSLTFYVHRTNSDWSSCHYQIVTSDGSEPLAITVETTSLHDLYERFGVPHYLKVDIEGADVFAAQQVAEFAVKPRHVSFETSRRDYAGLFSYLYVAGYRQFQLINQAHHDRLRADVQALDGTRFEYTFSRYASGLFGDDLPADRWRDFDSTLTSYMKYKELKQIDNRQLGLGWVDVHARHDD